MVTWLAIAGSLAAWLILVRMATGGPRLGRAVSRPGSVRCRPPNRQRWWAWWRAARMPICSR